MPEGPSIVILKEEVKSFNGKIVHSVSGNSRIDQSRLLNRKVLAFKSWGKHFLICFSDFTIRIHFLMWGSYRVNERKPAPPRLQLGFAKGELNFYSCSIRILEGTADENYDWTGDVMNEKWNPRKAGKKLRLESESMVCDTLLDQNIFAGVGNIIKNEVLHRIRVHPESITGKLPDRKRQQLIREARVYSFQFLEWKRKYELKKHWQVHNKKECPRCKLRLVRKHTGFRNRRSFFCTNCQKYYD